MSLRLITHNKQMENKTRVFISFKNSDNGLPTSDSTIAKALHDELYARNVRTFFSNVSLMSLGEATYKKSINDALDDADIMVVLASKAEYLTSKWIEYEWSSFHNDILSDEECKYRHIIPFLARDITRHDRPKELRDYQTFQLEVNSVKEVADFVESCLATVDKHKKPKQENDGAESIKIKQAINDRWSLYTSDYSEEFARLKVQAESTAEADIAVLKKLIKPSESKPRWILDVGCAYNFVGSTRFNKFDNVKVLGIDINDACLKYAEENSDGNIFTFRKLNVESDAFIDDLKTIMGELGIEKFDLVFMALVLHHLEWPVKVLRKLKKIIANDGYIFLRGSDDGSVLTYNDEGLTAEILDRCHKLYGFSDRQNGRKMFTQLIDAGYKDVKVESFMKDISDKDDEERWKLYFERFSYRVNNFEKLYKANPQDIEKKQQYEWMKLALKVLEDKFASPNFWYCEYDYIAYAKI